MSNKLQHSFGEDEELVVPHVKSILWSSSQQHINDHSPRRKRRVNRTELAQIQTFGRITLGSPASRIVSLHLAGGRAPAAAHVAKLPLVETGIARCCAVVRRWVVCWRSSIGEAVRV